ncbi:MAG: bifunctional precorrin-2 dehydrogenase/sirohydrochlorin ferrochelatase [Candidatus Methanofastidiosia archaeon]
MIPVLLKIEKALIFGGGRVAKRKVLGLESCEVTVVSENFLKMPKGIKKIKAKIDEKNFKDFLDNFDLVISALNDKELNERIANECRERKIPVNVVDSPELCNIYFPAVIRKQFLTLAVSTDGKCPFCSRIVKEKLKGHIEEIFPIVEILVEVREEMGGKTLKEIYKDSKFQNLLNSKNFKGAKRRAREIMCLS